MSAIKRAIRDVYGETLAQLGEENPDIVALDADVGSSSKSIYTLLLLDSEKLDH